MKHIVIDARSIETSTGRYMQRLVEEIHTSNPVNERYTIIVPRQYVTKWQSILPKFAIIGNNAAAYSINEQFSLLITLLKLRPNLVHFTMPQQPILYFNTSVTTIHDTTLLDFNNIGPQDNRYVYLFKKQVFRFLVWLTVVRSSAIITPTNFVKERLAQRYGQSYSNKIYVTLEAGEIPHEKSEEITKYSNTRYFHVIGNMFPYKNVQFIIDAFHVFQESHPDIFLLIAGKKDEFAIKLQEYVEQNNINNVDFLGFISDGEKRWLYENSQAYVTASLSEGFCIPVLEAMALNCPTLLSNASCLPETGGTAALYFNPSSHEELVDAMERITSDQHLRQELINKGHKHVASFSWKKMANETTAVYKKSLR